MATPTAPAKVTDTPGAKATATPTAAPTAVPTLRALDQGYKTAKAPEAKDPDTFPTTVPEAKIDPATATVYDEDFEDVETDYKVDGLRKRGYSGSGRIAKMDSSLVLR